MTQPLISDAAGVALSPLWLRESLKNIRAEFRSEGVESKEVSGLPLEEVEVSGLPLEEAEVSEQPSEGVLGKGSGWKERTVALWNAGRGLE